MRCLQCDLCVAFTVAELEKEYKCSKCPSSFHSASSLRMHMKGHAARRQFSCHMCDATLTSKLALTRHLQQHKAASSPRPQRHTHKCQWCPLAFRTSQQLKKHIRLSHAASGVEAHVIGKKGVCYKYVL
jgi:hypothetical protein